MATSLDGEGGQRPRVNEQLLPIATISMSLVGLDQVHMLPASLAATVPVFMATRRRRLGQGGGVVGAVPVMATMRPPLLPPDERHLVSGVASARKSSTRLRRPMAAAVRDCRR